jgi:hypothetical protein
VSYNLTHKIISNNIKDIHIEIESEIINSDSIFVFIYPLIYKVKKRIIKPSQMCDNVAVFNFDLHFVGKNKVKVFENKKLVKEYVYEKNDADELC